MHSSIDNDGTRQAPNPRAHSRPNTAPRFVRFQSRRNPHTAEPRANRAIATAISRQRIDSPVTLRRKERRRDCRELRQRASIADVICPRKPFGYPSPSKTFKHVSRQTNAFYNSKTAVLRNTPHFTHRLALPHRAYSAPFTQSFPKHITSSAHQPALSLRDIRLLTQKPTTDNRPFFKQPHHTACARIAARYTPLIALAAQAARSRYLAARTNRTKSAPSTACGNERRNRQARFSQTECRPIPHARFTPENLDKH